MTTSSPTSPTARRRIAYQGEPGANSDAACRAVVPELEPLPCQTFEDAFDAVESGRAELAMIPVENSIAGRVADIHHLLPESGLHIVGEYFMPIHFQLMAAPGTRLSQVRTVRTCSSRVPGTTMSWKWIGMKYSPTMCSPDSGSR